VTLEAYEEMKPTHAWHRAIIKKALYDCQKLRGLTLEEISDKVKIYLRNWYIKNEKPQTGRKRPTVDNRVREIKKEKPCVVVCLKGTDDLNHHWHVERWKEVPKHKVYTFFPSLGSGVLQQGEVLPK